MKKVAIYVRKSVEVKDSVSIETQTDMCKNYFADEKCEFEIFKDDGYTGANINRPAFQLLNKKLKLNMFNAVVCYKLDRLSRKVLDIADFFELLETKDIAFVCVKDKYDTTTPMGRAMLYFASVFAQLERETIAERVKDAMLNLAKRGCYTGGGVPKGYEIIKIEGKSYLQLKDEQFIKDVFYSYLNMPSLYSLYNKVRNYFEDDTNVQKGWKIRSILQSPVYVQSSKKTHEYLKKNGWTVYGTPNGNGYLTYNVSNKGSSMAIVSKHKSIVDDDTWLNIQYRLNEVSEKNLKRTSKTYWLSNFIKCPYCGSNYVLANSGRNTYYVCSNRLQRFNKTNDKCKNNKYINAIKLENTIDKLIETLSNKETFTDEYNKCHKNTQNDKLIKDIEKDIIKNNKMIDNLIDKLTILSNEAGKLVTNKIEQIAKQNAELRIQLENEKLQQIETRNFSEEYVYENIQIFIDTNDLDKKRMLVKNIFGELSYDPFANLVVTNLL